MYENMSRLARSVGRKGGYMKRFERLIALLLALLMLFSLASCAAVEGVIGGILGNEENPEEDPGPDPGTDPGDDPAEDPEEDPEDDPLPPHEHSYASEWSKDESGHWRAATCEHTTLRSDEAAHSFVDGFCVCGYAEPLPPHEHSYADEWSKDESGHWHAATCEHTTLRSDEGAHVYDPVSGDCICGAHEHIYASEWIYDDGVHWHGALCEHYELRSDEAAHSFVDGFCVCGYVKPTAPHVHSFSGEWTSDENQHWHAATCEHTGLRGDLGAHEFVDGVCICGQRPHVHEFSSLWTYNNTHHWHAATCSHTTLRSDEGEHVYDPVSGNCICGAHVHVYSEEWSKDETGHWHAATCVHTELRIDEAAHFYVKDVCVCGQIEPDYGPEPADHIKNGTTIGTMTQLIKMSQYVDSEGRVCRVLQGGCSDGTYYYAFFNDSLKDSAGNHSADSASVCYKYNVATKELVAVYEGLMIEHVNDATYLPDTNEIIAVHCSPNKNLLSVFDADTMELKRKFTIDFEIYSMAYDKYEQCYWVGLSYGDSFAKLDFNFNLIQRFDGVPYGYTRQGMDVDSEYIYFSRYQPNSIIVYDKQGNLVERIGVSITSYELENIFHIGDTFYLGYYTSSKGGILYSLEMTAVVGSGNVCVDMDKDDDILTLAQRTDAEGNICKVAQCSATDGTYIYFFMNNDVKASYVSSLYKYDIASGKIVATLDGFKTGHTNDVTYNPNTRELIVAQNSPAFILTIIDAETLTVKRDITIESDIFSIAYDEVNNCYYGSNRANRGIIKLDADFKFVCELTEGESVGYTRQAIDTDGTYIYMLNSAANGVWVYRVDGTFVGFSYLLPSLDTAQSICHIGDTFYVGYNVSKAGGIIYTASIVVTEPSAE